jgi:hypothetical protein
VPSTRRARAWPQFNHPVGRADHVRVVLDHDDGVAEVAQTQQRAHQRAVVARVQADARLVEHVRHTHQPHAQLRGQAHALRLTAAQGAVFALEREVAQPHFAQETQPLFESAPGLVHRRDQTRRVGAQLARKRSRLIHRQRHPFVKPAAVHAHRPRARVEPAPAAIGASGADLKGHQPRAQAFAARVAARFVQIRQHPRERLHFGLRVARPQLERKQPLARAEQQRVARRLRQLAPGHVGIVRQLPGELAQDGVALDDHRLRPEAPRLDRPVPHRFFRVRHDQVRPELERPPQPAAGGAGAFGVVVGKMTRRDGIVHRPTDGAGQLLAQRHLAPRPRGRVLHQRQRAVAPLAERQLERIGQAAALARLQFQPVHHQINRHLPRAPVEQIGLVQLAQDAVDPRAGEAALPQPRNFLPPKRRLRRLARRQQHHPAPRRLPQQQRDGVIERAALDQPAIQRAALLAGERPRQPRVIGDFGDGRDRAARVRAGAGALLDRDHRRQPVDEIHVRPRQLVEHLPRPHRQALHVFSVAFGIERIKGERRFARPAHACDDHQPVARQAQFQVL